MLSLLQTEMTNFSTLSYTSTSKIPTYPFIYLKPRENVSPSGRSLQLVSTFHLPGNVGLRSGVMGY